MLEPVAERRAGKHKLKRSASPSDHSMTHSDLVRSLDEQFSHIWMVRTFLKHSDEAEEDDELAEVHRTLYDCMHSLGRPLAEGDTEDYLKQVRKKLRKLHHAEQLFTEIQPEISDHTNFRMAAASLKVAVCSIRKLMDDLKEAKAER